MFKLSIKVNLAYLIILIEELHMGNEKNNRDNIPGQEKEFSIIVNGRKYEVHEKKISYVELLRLAGIQTGDTNTLMLVTFERGMQGKTEGSLTDGDTVNVKSGMVFNVSSTNKS